MPRKTTTAASEPSTPVILQGTNERLVVPVDRLQCWEASFWSYADYDQAFSTFHLLRDGSRRFIPIVVEAYDNYLVLGFTEA